MAKTVIIRNRYLLVADLILITAAVAVSFALRLDLDPDFLRYIPEMLWMTVSALVIKPSIFWSLGMYRRFWAYASIKEAILVFTTVTAGAVVLAIWCFFAYAIAWVRVPLSIPVIDWFLTLIFVGGFRFSIRVVSELRQFRRRMPGSGALKRALIAGAGDAGALVVREMQKNPQLRLMPVGFLDDAREKLHQRIHGVPVLGSLEQVGRVAQENEIDEVVIAMPSASGDVFRRIATLCRKNKIPFRTMPGLYELIGGRASASRLRNVDVSDLLRREQVRTADQAVGRTLNGKRVLVTGAGGSIGQELCRQIARWGPAQLIMMGHGENSIFEALLDLTETFPSLPIHPVVADIRDRERLHLLFRDHVPQVIFHAAAHKHVPLMEMNVEDAFTNNVIGTKNIVEESLAAASERMVLISSDKAIRPTSVMGATKRIAEMITLEAARRSGKPYVSVRFGNVLGSRGSVIPVFKRQIDRGGPVTITHPEMERFFMTIPEAVHLVLQAAGLGEGGETFILRMGKPVRIITLAEDLIRLSGLEPGTDIPIVFTGVRPGEKLTEQLWEDETLLRPTTHPDILHLAGENHVPDQPDLEHRIAEMYASCKEGDTQGLISLLNATAGGTLGQNPPPDLTAL